MWQWIRSAIVALGLAVPLFAQSSPAPAAERVIDPAQMVAHQIYQYGPYWSYEAAQHKTNQLYHAGWSARVVHRHDGWYVYAW